MLGKESIVRQGKTGVRQSEAGRVGQLPVPVRVRTERPQSEGPEGGMSVYHQPRHTAGSSSHTVGRSPQAKRCGCDVLPRDCSFHTRLKQWWWWWW